MLTNIFKGQAASLMLFDRRKKNMTFARFETTPSAIRAYVQRQLD